MERPKPVYKSKTTVTYKPTITKPKSSYVVSSSSSSSAGNYSNSSILSTWVFNKNINNKFYA
jgi:hypothetical protein